MKLVIPYSFFFHSIPKHHVPLYRSYSKIWCRFEKSPHLYIIFRRWLPHRMSQETYRYENTDDKWIRMPLDKLHTQCYEVPKGHVYCPTPYGGIIWEDGFWKLFPWSWKQIRQLEWTSEVDTDYGIRWVELLS